mgnify:FL=1
MDGRGEGVGHIHLREDDEGTVHRGAQPADVRVVEECAALVDYTKLVDIRIAGLDGALSYVCRPVRPRRQQLPDTMPTQQTKQTKKHPT